MKYKPFSEEWKKHGTILEIDTDGLLLKSDPILEDINKFITKKILLEFGIDNCTLELEKETFERGFIHKMKNYMLIEGTGDKQKIIVHGAYFKSSKASKVYDDAVKNIIDWALFDKLTAIEAKEKSLDNLRLRSLEDFVMRVKLSKNIKDYVLTKDVYYDSNNEIVGEFNPITSEAIYIEDNELTTHQLIHLAIQYKRITGLDPEKGTLLSYFVAIDPLTGKKTYMYYNAKDDTLRSVINFQAYEDQIIKLFHKTQICVVGTDSFEESDWFSEFENTKKENNS